MKCNMLRFKTVFRHGRKNCITSSLFSFLTNIGNHILPPCFAYKLQCTHNEQYAKHVQHLPDIWWVQTQYQLEYTALKHTAPDARKTGQVASKVLLAGAVWRVIQLVKQNVAAAFAMFFLTYDININMNSYFVALHSLMSYGITFWWNSAIKRHLWTMAATKWKVSCMEIVSKSNILPLASEHPLSVLSLIVDINKFRTNSNIGYIIWIPNTDISILCQTLTSV